jgi:DNA-directed RNA polymerase subunit RPC12/RpoP
MSFAAKWLGSKDIIYHDQSKLKNVENDKGLCKKIWKLLDEADVVIAQNGKRFDRPKINARLVVNGFLPPSPYKLIDTKIMAKRDFAFTSNRQEHLLRIFGKKEKYLHKKFPGQLLWTECLKGNPKAWEEMKKYNIEDVRGLEAIYLRLRPWSSVHPNLAVYLEEPGLKCPRCNSKRLARNGLSHPSVVGRYRRYRCCDCGGPARGSKLLNDKEQRSALLRVI